MMSYSLGISELTNHSIFDMLSSGKPANQVNSVRKHISMLCALCLAVGSIAFAAEPPKEGWVGEFRVRHEQADDSLNSDANANTARAAVSWAFKPASNVYTFVEVEHVSALGGEKYNDGGSNGQTQYAVIADPAGTEINQAYVFVTPSTNSSVTLGRQTFSLRPYPWQRHIGTVSWRQNEQTVDGVSASATLLERIDLDFAYIANVNRIFGEDNPIPNRANFELDGWILGGKVDLSPLLQITLFHLDLEFDTANLLSGTTTGARIDGTFELQDDVNLLYVFEVAQQNASFDLAQYLAQNSLDAPMYDTKGERRYQFAQVGVAFSQNDLTVKIANELLGEGTLTGFRAPLATLHAYQGWTDKFLATPVDGVSNTIISLSGSVDKAKLSFVYHWFSSERNDYSYGSEIGLSASYPFPGGFVGGIKVAAYSADSNSRNMGSLARDTSKLWIWIQKNVSVNCSGSSCTWQ